MDNVRSTMLRIFVPIWWLFGSTVLAGLFLRWWVGDQVSMTRYTGYVMPWLLLGLVPGTAWAWVRRRKPLAAIMGASAAIVIAVPSSARLRPSRRGQRIRSG
jgi:hypothetical protein